MSDTLCLYTKHSLDTKHSLVCTTGGLVTVPIAAFRDNIIVLLGSELISTIWPGEYNDIHFHTHVKAAV